MVSVGFGAEDFENGQAEGLDCVGLVDDASLGAEGLDFRGHIDGAGDEDDFEAGAALAEFARKVDPGLFGHDHVGNEQVDGPADAVPNGAGFFGVFGAQDKVAGEFENSDGQEANGRFVFDDQNCFTLRHAFSESTRFVSAVVPRNLLFSSGCAAD